MAEIYFTKDHEWIKVEDNIGVVGITAYASEQLGDIVFVELPEEGITAEIGKDIAVVESVKAASEVYSPVSGTITKSNENLMKTHNRSIMLLIALHGSHIYRSEYNGQ